MTIADLVNTTASGALSNASTVAGGNFGQIIMFFVGLSILLAIVGLVYRAVKKS